MSKGGYRPGSGRKPAFEKSTVVTVRIKDSIIAKKPEGMSKSEFVNNAIEEYLKIITKIS